MHSLAISEIYDLFSLIIVPHTYAYVFINTQIQHGQSVLYIYLIHYIYIYIKSCYPYVYVLRGVYLVYMCVYNLEKL